jgi:hypothetical protein
VSYSPLIDCNFFDTCFMRVVIIRSCGWVAWGTRFNHRTCTWPRTVIVMDCLTSVFTITGLRKLCDSAMTLTAFVEYKHLLTYLFTYLLTPWSIVLLETLTGLQLVKKFPTFCETRRFITAFTFARHLSLSWTSSIQSITPRPTSLKFHLSMYYPPIYVWVSPVVSFPQVSPPKPCTRLSSPPSELHVPPISFLFILSPAQ